MKAISIAALLSVAAVLAGCATVYQPKGLTGGFAETQLDTNVFRVSFQGNGYTGTERAEDIVLLRSAELTLTHGFTHFVIVDAKSRIERDSFTTPVQSYTTANVTTIGNHAYGSAHTTTTGGQTIVFSKPRTTNTIVAFAGRPDIPGMVYDARMICDSVGPKYKVICGAEI
uniref:CC0125/CC1285 family lipoprotein n=1 Tax=Cupriavidus yeoncheonensis TaxID=1462994 RepID=UPI003F4923C2